MLAWRAFAACAGSMPEEWGSFSAVPVVIDVGQNQLTGSLPSWSPVDKQGMQLAGLDASENFLSGTHSLTGT